MPRGRLAWQQERGWARNGKPTPPTGVQNHRSPLRPPRRPPPADESAWARRACAACRRCPLIASGLSSPDADEPSPQPCTEGRYSAHQGSSHTQHENAPPPPAAPASPPASGCPSPARSTHEASAACRSNMWRADEQRTDRVDLSPPSLYTDARSSPTTTLSHSAPNRSREKTCLTHRLSASTTRITNNFS